MQYAQIANVCSWFFLSAALMNLKFDCFSLDFFVIFLEKSIKKANAYFGWYMSVKNT